MGRMKDLATDPQEYFADDDPSYLTMARFMSEGWVAWSKDHIRIDDTGHTMLRAQKAYKDGFMAGFEARFFKQND